MKTSLAASFALIAALSGFSSTHAAGFNDRSEFSSVAVSSQAERQDLSHLPAVQGFNQQSHHARAARAAAPSTGRASVVAGVHCDLPQRVGFNESTSFASC